MKKGKEDRITKLIRTPGKNPSHLKVAIYGASGTGKTTFAATFPKPLLHIDIKEDTDRVLQGIDGVETISIDNTDDYDELYWWLKENPNKYKTVVIDTISQLQEITLQEYVDTLKQPTMGRPMITQKGWGIVSSEMKVGINKYRSLGIDIVFIAQNRTFNFGEDGALPQNEIQPEIGPAVMPSVSSYLNASVDVLGNTFIRETIEKRKTKTDGKVTIDAVSIKNYSMRLGAHAIYTVKVRNAKNTIVPEFITDPNYDVLLTIIEGNYNG